MSNKALGSHDRWEKLLLEERKRSLGNGLKILNDPSNIFSFSFFDYFLYFSFEISTQIKK